MKNREDLNSVGKDLVEHPVSPENKLTDQAVLKLRNSTTEEWHRFQFTNPLAKALGESVAGPG